MNPPPWFTWDALMLAGIFACLVWALGHGFG